MDYNLLSPVGPSSGRECPGPADMGIWVPMESLIIVCHFHHLASRTSICKWKSFMWAQIILATCSSRNLASPTKVVPNNAREVLHPHSQTSLSSASSSSLTLASICPNPLPMRLVVGASLWPSLEGLSVRIPTYVPVPSPQASNTTCLPGEEQG